MKPTSLYVTIPFLDEFKEPLQKGYKTATSRTKKMGRPGQVFNAFGDDYLLTHVVRMPLDIVSRYLYFEEGFDTRRDFIECWKRIHPRRGFQVDDHVHLHLFRRLLDV